MRTVFVWSFQPIRLLDLTRSPWIAEARALAPPRSQVSSKCGTWYSKRVITVQFMWVGYLAGVACLRYTVLTNPIKGETAVHCCDSALSVLVMLVYRNVFHVVSVLQSIVSIPAEGQKDRGRRGRDLLSRSWSPSAKTLESSIPRYQDFRRAF